MNIQDKFMKELTEGLIKLYKTPRLNIYYCFYRGYDSAFFLNVGSYISYHRVLPKHIITQMKKKLYLKIYYKDLNLIKLIKHKLKNSLSHKARLRCRLKLQKELVDSRKYAKAYWLCRLRQQNLEKYSNKLVDFDYRATEQQYKEYKDFIEKQIKEFQRWMTMEMEIKKASKKRRLLNIIAHFLGYTVGSVFYLLYFSGK